MLTESTVRERLMCAAGCDLWPPSWFKARLQEACTAISLFPVGPVARALYRTLTQERTMSTYNLFAVLTKG